MSKKTKITSKAKPAMKVEPKSKSVTPPEPAEQKPVVKDDSRMMKAVEYRVAPGRSITSKRGILGPGTVLTPRVFHGGEEDMRRLIVKGYVVKD